jgi:chemotaxis family two-component system sensor kinase Cph1
VSSKAGGESDLIKESEKDIRLSELELMKATLDQHAATARVDVNGQFISVNEKFCASSGYSSKELIGQDINILNSGIHPPAGFKDLWNTAVGGRSWHGELCNRAKDGTLNWGATSITPHLDPNGDIDSFIYVATDITDRVIAEQALEESVQAHKQSNEDLQRFANIVSHDLREPLRMVSSFVALLSRKYGDKLDDKAGQYIKFAVDGTQRMQDLLEGLLEFSRVQTHGEPFSDLDLTDAVEAAVKNLTILVEDTGAEITIEPLATVKGDKAQLMQVFQNLIANAIRFCKEAPPVVHISATQEENSLSIAVTDQGIGIEPKNFERVFQIFQRLHARQEYEGTGVGLAVCKRIMERHNGTISVQSEAGQGSTFTLKFPV